MKALIRNEEVYKETDWSEFTRNHLAYMTGTEKDTDGNVLPGDGWTLVDDYVAPAGENNDTYAETVTENEEETVTINGVTYTKSQLRALLGE